MGTRRRYDFEETFSFVTEKFLWEILAERIGFASGWKDHHLLGLCGNEYNSCLKTEECSKARQGVSMCGEVMDCAVH